MGTSPISDEQINALIDYTSFDNLKDEESLKITFGNFKCFSDDMVFFNQGKIGNWKNYLSENASRKIDEMLASKLTYNRRPIQFEPSQKRDQKL